MRDVYVREGEAASNLYACTVGTLRVAKRKKTAEVVAWVELLAQQDPVALDLLGRYILSLTRGVDPAVEDYPIARRVLGYETPEEVADAGGGSKSGD